MYKCHGTCEIINKGDVQNEVLGQQLRYSFEKQRLLQVASIHQLEKRFLLMLDQ